MGRSLGLAAYRALARRQFRPATARQLARPQGEVLWAHATTEARFSALCDLSLRLRTMRPDLHLLITVEQARFDPPPAPLAGCDHIISLESDHHSSVQDFLGHWSPNLCLWTGGDLMPNLIHTARDLGIPMILLDIGETDFPTRRHKWYPDLTRTILNCFDVILVNSEPAARTVQRLGVSGPKITVTAPLRNSATPPSCSDDELGEVTRDIASRPVWLAAHVRADEFDAVLTAHRLALRLVHRLLLILVIDNADDADTLNQALADSGMRSVDWDTGGLIEDSTQVVVSRDEDNLGLWYRVAPLTFMGCSMSADGTGRSPLEAAALGSAVLYGLNVKNHIEAYARLAAAGAARSVRDGDGLGGAVIQLVAPDHAAAMALAGWEVVTEGAHLTDNLIELILDFLDLRGAHDAPA